ncbi:hypothetical protein TIFTF001_027017 [Ficus carica]|uniref:Uncharacterized protein n=1 Tax=Ficus carica TaxID=3494 RepID=A0AA88DMA1_FICCA|nr:hypothetical protein TIFTF001_027017 [Ficus carica]
MMGTPVWCLPWALRCLRADPVRVGGGGWRCDVLQ